MQASASQQVSGKHKIAAITIGQSPRIDIQEDLFPMLSPSILWCEYGALDKFEISELLHSFHHDINPESLATDIASTSFLVSRLRDGSEIFFPEENIFPLIQTCITKAELEGCEATVLLCTGEFPPFVHNRPLFIPRHLLYALLPHLIGNQRLGILFPNEVQVQNFSRNTALLGHGLVREQIFFSSASPYQDENVVIQQVLKLHKEASPALIYLDCIGYSCRVKQKIEEKTGKPVLLPRTMLARILNELY